MKRPPPWLRWLASALVLVLAAWLLLRALRGLSQAQVQAALLATPASALLASLLATAVSFACLAVYERVATQWLAPGKIPCAVAWRTGLIAHALANTLGFHPVTAVALRFERYRAHGVDAGKLARIVAAIGGCVASGVLAMLAVAGAWWLWQSGRFAIVSIFALVLTVAGLVVARRVRQVLPQSRMLSQLGRVFGIGLLEMTAAVLALWVLVPDGALPGGPAFVYLFVGATLLGIVSHAPGGLGVFEATVLAAATPSARAQVLAALLAYRVLYNLLPCALALMAVGAESLRLRLSSTAGTRP